MKIRAPSKGAAHVLINELHIERFVSNISKKELAIVVQRLHLKQDALKKLVSTKCKTIAIRESLHIIKKDFGIYTLDENDAHVVAGAVKTKAKFLVSYNIRDFKREKIKKDFYIIVATPAQFLQYLRSLS